MARYARIEDGVVFERLETDGDIKTMFPPELIWIDVTGVEGVSDGWIAEEVNGQWSVTAPPPPTPPDLTVAQQIAELESTVTPRRLREAILTGDHAFLQSVEDAVEQLRILL